MRSVKEENRQKGFTLIELIVSLAISVALIGGTTAAIFQVFEVGEKSKSHMSAAEEVENAGYWIGRDSQMAQSISLSDDAGTVETEVLTLRWVGWPREEGNEQCIDSYEVAYSYDNNQIWRREKVTTEKYDSNGHFIEATESTSSLLVAQNITALSISLSAGKVVVDITASVGEATERRIYEIKPRPSS